MKWPRSNDRGWWSGDKGRVLAAELELELDVTGGRC
jgi:hypothetical protein